MALKGPTNDERPLRGGHFKDRQWQLADCRSTAAAPVLPLKVSEFEFIGRNLPRAIFTMRLRSSLEPVNQRGKHIQAIAIGRI
jgi:hypothetical protein